MAECLHKLSQKYTASFQPVETAEFKDDCFGSMRVERKKKIDHKDTATPLFPGEVQDAPQDTDILLQVHY